MMNLRKLFFAAIVLLCSLGISGTVFAAPAKNTVTYAMYADMKDWDPAIAFSMEVVMLVNVYEPLLWYNPPGSKDQFTPALATDWSVSDDGLTWTFHLRKGVKFHDGDPMNATAAKASLDRTMKMKKGAYYIWSGVTAITASDEYTLVIKTKTPLPIDLIASSQYGSYIYSPKAAEKGTDWFNQGHDAGTGPYYVRQWVKGQHVVLERNDDFWGGWNNAKFDRVLLKVVNENATQMQMLKSGEADFISLVPADAVATLNQRPGITAEAVPSWKNSQFLINTKVYPTDNTIFRQALTYIWDYQSVVRDIYAGHADVAQGIIPKTMWGHNAKLVTPTFDLKKAAKLLKESGVPKKDWNISMAYIGTSEEYKNSALLFQENARQIGLKVDLKPGEWGVIWNNAKKLETAPNLQSMTWWPTYPTPNDWLMGLFHTEKKTLFNLSHYSNPEFDKLIDEGAALEGSDRPQAIKNYGKAQQILIDDATAIFYADIKKRIARKSNISGLVNNPAYSGVFFYQLSRK